MTVRILVRGYKFDLRREVFFEIPHAKKSFYNSLVTLMNTCFLSCAPSVHRTKWMEKKVPSIGWKCSRIDRENRFVSVVINSWKHEIIIRIFILKLSYYTIINILNITSVQYTVNNILLKKIYKKVKVHVNLPGERNCSFVSDYHI